MARPEVIRIVCDRKPHVSPVLIMPFIWGESGQRWDTTMDHVGYAPAGPWPAEPTQEWLVKAVREALVEKSGEVHLRYDLRCPECRASTGFRVRDETLQPWLDRAADQGADVIPVRALELVIGSAHEPHLPDI